MTQEVLELLQSPESTEAGDDMETEAGSLPPETPDRSPAVGAASPQIPNRSPAERVRFGKEEGRSGVQFSPQGGNGTARVSSDVDPVILSHLSSLRAQEAELRREIPEFRLEDALQDKDFLRLTSPTVGVSVRRAYFALHGAERERRAAEESARRLAQSVASGASRPREGGGQSGAALTGLNPRALSAGQRQALKERILAAAARGEKVYP